MSLFPNKWQAPSGVVKKVNFSTPKSSIGDEVEDHTQGPTDTPIHVQKYGLAQTFHDSLRVSPDSSSRKNPHADVDSQLQTNARYALKHDGPSDADLYSHTGEKPLPKQSYSQSDMYNHTGDKPTQNQTYSQTDMLSHTGEKTTLKFGYSQSDIYNHTGDKSTQNQTFSQTDMLSHTEEKPTLKLGHSQTDMYNHTGDKPSLKQTYSQNDMFSHTGEEPTLKLRYSQTDMHDHTGDKPKQNQSYSPTDMFSHTGEKPTYSHSDMLKHTGDSQIYNYGHTNMFSHAGDIPSHTQHQRSSQTLFNHIGGIPIHTFSQGPSQTLLNSRNSAENDKRLTNSLENQCSSQSYHNSVGPFSHSQLSSTPDLQQNVSTDMAYNASGVNPNMSCSNQHYSFISAVPSMGNVFSKGICQNPRCHCNNNGSHVTPISNQNIQLPISQSRLGQNNSNLSQLNNSIQKVPRRSKEPDKFDGKSVDWRDYMVHFENVSNWNGWDDVEKSQQLVMSLRGSAQKLFSDLRLDQMNNYHYMVQDLNRRFNPAERGTAYRCEYRNRKQQKSETVSEYGYALQRLCIQAFQCIPPEAREIYIIDQYINGLTRPEIRSHVQYRHPKTIDSAIALAVEFEAFESSQGILRKPRFEDKLEVNSINENATMQELYKMIENLTKTINRGNRSRSNSRDRSSSRDRSNTKKGYGDIECYNCHELGHIAPKCPKKKSENY